MTRRVYQGGNQSQGSGTGGAQTLTGDATGTLSGTSIATTVVALQGNAVAAGTPTTGGFLTWQGSSWASSTKLLYTDSTGALSWIASASPLITQAAPTSDVATADLVLTPQAPYAGASTHVVGGNVRVNLAAPISGSVESCFNIFRAGVAAPQITMGPFPGASNSAIWFQTPSPSTTNYAFLGTNTGVTVLNAASTVYLALGNTSALHVDANFNTYLGTATSASGGVGGVVVFQAATTNPTSAAASGNAILYVDHSAVNARTVDPSGTVSALAPASSGTTNTQARVLAKFHATARISTSGNTTTLSVPLATSTTNCYFSATALIKIATAGSLNAVGDTFGSTIDGYVKNVAGTLTIVGSTVSVATGSDTTLNTSTFAASVSGTNIVLTLTATATSGTIGNADCTIYVSEQVIN